MYRIEFFETREEYEIRRPDSTFNVLNWVEVEAVISNMINNNPDAVVSVGPVKPIGKGVK
jgi:hypothetical protein